MIDEKLIIQPALDAITLGRDAQLVPLAKCRSLHVHADDPTAALVVIVQIEVVLQGIGSDHVIAALGETEDDSGGGVLTSQIGLNRTETSSSV